MTGTKNSLKDAYKRGVEYEIMLVQNIANITYGGKVSHTLQEKLFEEFVTEISGTEIKQKLREEGKLYPHQKVWRYP